MMKLIHRFFKSILPALLLLSSFSLLRGAEIELQITKQIGRKIDLALAPFKNRNSPGDASLKAFEQTVAFDLDQSGFFKLIPHQKEILSLSNAEPADSMTQASQWRGLGTDVLVKAIYEWNGTSGNLEVYAFDVEGQRRIFAKKYLLQQNNLKKTAHTCANDIIYRMTGERGIAGTRIAYVAGGSRGKEVFICDADGKNVRQLTQDGSIILGVSWNPSGNQILYTSFKGGRAGIYIHDLTRGQRQSLPAYPGLNAAAKFSPDGSRIASVLSKDGNPEIYISDLQGRNLRRITNHPSVDSSPCWSPDGQKIAFVSDRSGRPHLYVQDLKGGPLRRLTHQGSYNASPSWSPKGDKIAFSSNMDGSFKICVLDLNQETITIVSQEGGEAEEPDWAPDGRHIIYSSKVGGVHQLFMVDISDGRTIRLSSNRVHHLTPAWSF
jgi:TolB protein